jgi:NADH-quinone oxidoreductase subunit L
MPLHVWLPDAMEGPTPVSALIHAATMVAAGIYMLCRIEVLMVRPRADRVIMWTGTVTAVYAALCAIVQSDIKKVLAYSTLSQLGYMVAAFGLGSLTGPTMARRDHSDGHRRRRRAAMFHLTTHAFFKALMFLGSGSVIHGCHHEQDIFKMGGLRKKMPLTFITFTIGVPPSSASRVWPAFSRRTRSFTSRMRTTSGVCRPRVTAVLTAFYMVRMWKARLPRRNPQRQRRPRPRERSVDDDSADRARRCSPSPAATPGSMASSPVRSPGSCRTPHGSDHTTS